MNQAPALATVAVLLVAVAGWADTASAPSSTPEGWCSAAPREAVCGAPATGPVPPASTAWCRHPAAWGHHVIAWCKGGDADE